eukprot:5968072-Pyramimonas_sp.AAC.1
MAMMEDDVRSRGGLGRHAGPVATYGGLPGHSCSTMVAPIRALLARAHEWPQVAGGVMLSGD